MEDIVVCTLDEMARIARDTYCGPPFLVEHVEMVKSRIREWQKDAWGNRTAQLREQASMQASSSPSRQASMRHAACACMCQHITSSFCSTCNITQMHALNLLECCTYIAACMQLNL